jgi:hypothetical protein
MVSTRRIIHQRAMVRPNSAASMSVASDSDNAALIREMHGHTAPAPGTSSSSLQTVHLSTQFQSQSSRPFIRMLSPLLISALSDLLDQDSEMQRALGVADSFDSASTHQAPSCRFLTLLINNLSHSFGPQSPKWQSPP